MYADCPWLTFNFFLVIPRVGDKFYCNHCNETVSKSTFYEHKALYGDSVCGFPNDSNEELELNVDCDSDNESCIIASWDDEDRQFFSEDNTSDDDGNTCNGDNDKDNEDGEMASEESSVAETESSPQPGHQDLVS